MGMVFSAFSRQFDRQLRIYIEVGLHITMETKWVLVRVIE